MLERAILLLNPAACLGCRRLAARRHPLGLCLACRGQLMRVPPGLCAGCGRRGADPTRPAARCPRCRDAHPTLGAVVAPYLYADPLAQVLWSFKFRALRYLADDLGARLAEELVTRHRLDPRGYDLLVPVPLHWLRRLRRGYDQAALLANALGAALDLPVRAALRRRHATRPQSDLSRADRLGNLAGAFTVTSRCRVGVGGVAGARVLLVDDVVTTGATVEAAARALRRAGARQVDAAAIARTPPDRLS